MKPYTVLLMKSRLEVTWLYLCLRRTSGYLGKFFDVLLVLCKRFSVLGLLWMNHTCKCTTCGFADDVYYL